MALNKTRIAIYLANLLDHFDSALYGFLVPLIAPLFFNSQDNLTNLIKGYGILVLGILTRPLGAWYFSKLAQTQSPNYSLRKTIQGITFTTLAFVIIQPYSKWGIWSAVSLCVLKSLQNFFSSGEVSIASLYVLENSKKSERATLSSIFLTSTILGIGMASFAASIIYYLPDPQNYWKWPFYFSVITACTSWGLRKFNTKQKNIVSTVTPTRIDWKMVIKLVPIMALYYVTYSVPMVFFNSFAPLLTPYKIVDFMACNTGLLVLDCVLMLLLGKVFANLSPARILKVAALSCVIITPLLFILIPDSSFATLTLMRVIMIVIGVSFSVPLYKYLFEILPEKSRYQTTALSYAVGSEVFGRSFPAVGLFLWQISGAVVMPALYVSLIGACALLHLMIMKDLNTVSYIQSTNNLN